MVAVLVTGLEGICLCRRGKTVLRMETWLLESGKSGQEWGTVKTKEKEWPVASHATERASDIRANVTQGPS